MNHLITFVLISSYVGFKVNGVSDVDCPTYINSCRSVAAFCKTQPHQWEKCNLKTECSTIFKKDPIGFQSLKSRYDEIAGCPTAQSENECVDEFCAVHQGDKERLAACNILNWCNDLPDRTSSNFLLASYIR